MKKKVVLISGSLNTQIAISYQLKEFISAPISLKMYASEVYIPQHIECDLLIISSESMKEDLDRMLIHIDCKHMVICKRTVNFERIGHVAGIQPNTDVLLVNDEKETSEAAIQSLIDLGFNHINYNPYYPALLEYPKLSIAITPGESDKVPPCVEEIIDIGSRILDIETLYEITDSLELDSKSVIFSTQQYMKKIIQISASMSDIHKRLNTLNNQLNQVIDNLVNGIMVFNEDGYIVYVNDEMKKLLLMENKAMGNKNLKSFFDKEILTKFLSREVYEDESLTIMGKTVKVSKFLIPQNKNIIVTTREDSRDNLKKEYDKGLLMKGHIAKYKIDDIIGHSPAIQESKNIALKLSKSELTILIEGESGTGKELFASAIHNNSNRNKGPFIAVNCSAFPDELIESELFGYEEGAFTGAKKGGKEGLFELANGGTLFLDEIGDISPKLQTKLLRVLQEKEIMMLGGSIIKRIDVRVIVATNKNLRQMVYEKQFRSDLYYRLKVGYIKLPPLRERMEDIESLVEVFIKNETVSEVSLSKDVLREFKKYKWLGNARELENTIKFMLAVRKGKRMDITDLPGRGFFEERENNNLENIEKNPLEELGEDLIQILLMIKKLTSNRIVAGRTVLSEALKNEGYSFTESQMRSRLEFLSKHGYILQKKGRHGTVLSKETEDKLNSK